MTGDLILDVMNCNPVAIAFAMFTLACIALMAVTCLKA